MGHIHEGDSKKDVCFAIEVSDINLPVEYLNVQIEFALNIKSQLWQFYQKERGGERERKKTSKRILRFTPSRQIIFEVA